MPALPRPSGNITAAVGCLQAVLAESLLLALARTPRRPPPRAAHAQQPAPRRQPSAARQAVGRAWSLPAPRRVHWSATPGGAGSSPQPRDRSETPARRDGRACAISPIRRPWGATGDWEAWVELRGVERRRLPGHTPAKRERFCYTAHPGSHGGDGLHSYAVTQGRKGDGRWSLLRAWNLV